MKLSCFLVRSHENAMISHHSYPCFMLKCHKNPVKSPFFVVKYHHIPMRSLLFLGEIPRESAPTPRLHQLLHLSAATAVPTAPGGSGGSTGSGARRCWSSSTSSPRRLHSHFLNSKNGQRKYIYISYHIIYISYHMYV